MQRKASGFCALRCSVLIMRALLHVTPFCLFPPNSTWQQRTLVDRLADTTAPERAMSAGVRRWRWGPTRPLVTPQRQTSLLGQNRIGLVTADSGPHLAAPLFIVHTLG